LFELNNNNPSFTNLHISSPNDREEDQYQKGNSALKYFEQGQPPRMEVAMNN